MSEQTGIEWTDATWNPTTGCTKVSPGCAHCYIERTPAFRIAGRRFDAQAHIPMRLHEDRLEQPLHWLKPRRVFVNSLSDLFHPDVPDAFIDRVFAVMALCPQHTFQVLTKRAVRTHLYLANPRRRDLVGVAAEQIAGADARDTLIRFWPLLNVWLMVSVENQHFADERIPLLLATPATVRGISAEPLLGGLNLEPFVFAKASPSLRATFMLAEAQLLDWVIVGGESGPGARPFDLAWARSIVAQCKAAGVACFVKQLGAAPHSVQDRISHRGNPLQRPNGFYRHFNDKKGGDPSEWPEDLCVREFPEVAHVD